MFINVSGSALIGWVATATLPARLGWPSDLRVFVMTGFCGGFTTFSAFSLQTVELLLLGEVVAAAVYAAASVALCVNGAWAGVLLGRA